MAEKSDSEFQVKKYLKNFLFTSELKCIFMSKKTILTEETHALDKKRTYVQDVKSYKL